MHVYAKCINIIYDVYIYINIYMMYIYINIYHIYIYIYIYMGASLYCSLSFTAALLLLYCCFTAALLYVCVV